MNRRESLVKLGKGFTASSLLLSGCAHPSYKKKLKPKELKSDLVIIGGGLGGCACALAALRSGLNVIMTEETDWIGGQLTSQGVPPDEHRWIESFGCTKSYRELRNAIRNYYKKHYPLTSKAKESKYFNPGAGSVSRLCHEPEVALKCLNELLLPYVSRQQLTILTNSRITGADVDGDSINYVEVINLKSGSSHVLNGKIFADATELGDLLHFSKCEHVMGTEGKKATGELHMPQKASSANQQAFTMCFALDYDPGKEHIIDKPKQYEFWRNYVPELMPPWPGRLLDFTYTHPSSLEPRLLGFNPDGPHQSGIINLWRYRRILSSAQFDQSSGIGDVSLINWPQNDYMEGNLAGVTDELRQHHINNSKQLSLSLLYWLQTEAPREDGGEGWPGLRLRKDIMSTEDGLAKFPYVRESRRIKALTAIFEHHCGTQARQQLLDTKENVTAQSYQDSVGIGQYPIDLHPTSEGDNYIDFSALPFELPLGALIPQRLENLIPTCKNIGTTHITNGCYRLHPVEWNIGEVAGYLASSSISKGHPPRSFVENTHRLKDFQDHITGQGVEIHWPTEIKSNGH